MAEIGALSRVTGGVAGCDKPLDFRRKIGILKMARKLRVPIESNSNFFGGRVWVEKICATSAEICVFSHISGRILVCVPVIPAVAEVQNSSTGSQVTPQAELIEMVQYAKMKIEHDSDKTRADIRRIPREFVVSFWCRIYKSFRADKPSY